MEAIYSIKPKYIDLIIKRNKNHEFRNKLPSKTPNIIWIYATVPLKEIKYFIEVEKPVTYPNTINENGIGNIEFNKGMKQAKHAYPIKHLYQLEKSIELRELKSEYDFTAPQSFIYLNSNNKLKNHLKELKYIKIY